MILALTVCVSVWAESAYAQVEMPDPSAIAGTPLPAPELASGTVTVRVVRERMGNNIAGQDVTLTIGQDKRTLKTDAQGRAEFGGLKPGTSIQATTTVDGETLTSQTFPVPDRGGVRVALIAGIAAAKAAEKAAAEEGARAPARPGVVEIGPESRVIIEYQDDNLTVFYLLEVINSARTPIDIGGPLLIRLPRGAAGASVMQGSSQHASAKGDMLTITGPFPPGKTVAQVGFSLPQATANYTLQQTWPIAVAQVTVGMQKIGNMQLSSPQISKAQEMNSDGQSFIMAQGGRLNAGDTLVLNLTGLPAHSQTPRYAALALALVIFVLGAWFAFGPRKAAPDDDPRLKAQRDKLMDEVVGLERRRRERGLTAAETARMQRVSADLERVLAELDSAYAPGRYGATGSRA